MNVYFHGGKIRDFERLEKWTDDWTMDTAPKFKKIGVYKFKLHHVMSIDGGFIYYCVNETIEPCNECNGHGSYVCESCDGTGHVECDFCEGQGTLRPEETPREKKNRELKAEQKVRMERDQIKLEFE